MWRPSLAKTMDPIALAALEEFVFAAQKLTGLWTEHLGDETDITLCDAYPPGWKDFDELVDDASRWLEAVQAEET